MSMGLLTTHVLDTERGRAASGVKIEVMGLVGRHWSWLCEVETNADGRTSSPLLGGAKFVSGLYELRFHVGSYLESTRGAQSTPSFLDIVVIRFGVSAPDQHYHVPLLLQSFGYATYRGT